jgi:hypothetical protein
MVLPVPSESPVALRQVGRHRRSRANHLVGNGLEGSRDPSDEPDRGTCRGEGRVMGDESVVRGDFGHGDLRFVHALPRAGGVGDVKGAKHRAQTGPPLTSATHRLSGRSDEPEVTMAASRTPWSAPVGRCRLPLPLTPVDRRCRCRPTLTTVDCIEGGLRSNPHPMQFRMNLTF